MIAIRLQAVCILPVTSCSEKWSLKNLVICSVKFLLTRALCGDLYLRIVTVMEQEFLLIRHEYNQ